MRMIRCDRCGADIREGDGKEFAPIRGPQEIHAQQKGHFQFEPFNCTFVAEGGAVQKVDLCAQCCSLIARPRRRGDA